MVAGEIKETAVQAALVNQLTGPQLGWRSVEAVALPRRMDDVLIEEEVVANLVRLNPVIAEAHERADEVLSRLRAVILSPANDGLVAANEEMVAWLCGRKTMRFVGTD